MQTKNNNPYVIIEVVSAIKDTTSNKNLSVGDWLYCKPISKQKLKSNSLYVFNHNQLGIVFRKPNNIAIENCDTVYSITKQLKSIAL